MGRSIRFQGRDAHEAPTKNNSPACWPFGLSTALQPPAELSGKAGVCRADAQNGRHPVVLFFSLTLKSLQPASEKKRQGRRNLACSLFAARASAGPMGAGRLPPGGLSGNLQFQR